MRDINGFRKKINKKIKERQRKGVERRTKKLKPNIKESIMQKGCRTPPSEKKKKKTAGVLFETQKRRGRRRKKNGPPTSVGVREKEKKRGEMGCPPIPPHALIGPE